MKSSIGIESLTENNHSEWIEAILSLQNKKECQAFFEDLCSVEELDNIATRYAIAMMLVRGNTYREIIDQLNVANATISRVKSVIEKEDSSLRKVIQRQIDKG